MGHYSKGKYHMREVEFFLDRLVPDGNVKMILLKRLLGKRYITNPDISKKQSGQKGPACWFYSLNGTRTRYGKDYPDTAPERKIEKIFSDFCKENKKLYDRHELENTFLKKFLPVRQKKIKKNDVKKRLDVLTSKK